MQPTTAQTPGTQQVDVLKRDLALLGSIIKEYEAKLSNEAKIRDAMLAKQAATSDSFAQAQMQQQLDFSNKRIEILSAELVKYMTQQSDLQARLRGGAPSSSAPAYAQQQQQQDQPPQPQQLSSSRLAPNTGSLPRNAGDRSTAALGSSRMRAATPSFAAPRSTPRIGGALSSPTRETPPPTTLGVTGDGQAPPPRKSSINSSGDGQKYTSLERIKNREVEDLRNKVMLLTQQRRELEQQLRRAKLSLSPQNGESNSTQQQQQPTRTVPVIPPGLTREMESLRQQVATLTREKAELEVQSKAAAAASAIAASAASQAKSSTLMPELNDFFTLDILNDYSMDRGSKPVLDPSPTSESAKHDTSDHSVYARWACENQSSFAAVRTWVDSTLPLPNVSRDPAAQYTESVWKLETKLTDAEFELIECVRTIASLKHVLQQAALQQSKVKGDGEAQPPNTEHYNDMMTSLIMALSMCMAQKEALHTPAPYSLRTPDSQKIVEYIKTAAATDAASVVSGDRSASQEFRSTAKLAGIPESPTDRSAERMLTAQLQQQKASSAELQKQLDGARQQLRDLDMAARKMEKRNVEFEALKDRLKELTVAKSAAEAQRNTVAADMDKQQAELSQLRQDYRTSRAQLLKIEQALQQERDSNAAMREQILHSGEEQSRATVDLREALQQSERKLAEAVKARQESQDNFATIQSRILYLEAKERELTTQLKREAAKHLAERQELQQQLEQARSGTHENAKQAFQNLSDLDTALKSQTAEVEKMRLERSDLIQKINEVRAFAERQKREYDFVLNQLKEKTSTLMARNEELENERQHWLTATAARAQMEDEHLRDARQHLEEALSDKATLESDLANAQRESQDLRSELQRLDSERQTRDDNYGELEGALATKDSEIAALRSALAEHQTRSEALLAGQQEHTEEKALLSEQITDLQAQIQELHEERSRLSADQDDQSTTSRQTTLAVSNLNPVAGARSSVLDLQEMYVGKVHAMQIVQADLEAQIAQLQQEKETAVAELRNMESVRDEHLAAVKELAVLTERVTEAEQQLQVTQQSLKMEAQVREEVEAVAAQYKEQLSVALQAAEEHGKSEETIHSLLSELQQTKALTAQYEEQVQEANAMREYTASLEAKVQSTMAMIEHLELEKQDLTTELEELRRKASATDTLVSSLRGEVITAKQQISRQSAELDTVLKNCSELEQMLNAERQRAQALAEDLRQHQTEADHEIEELQAKLQELETQAPLSSHSLAEEPETDIMSELVRELKRERDLLRIKEEEINELERQVHALRVAMPAQSVTDSAHDEEADDVTTASANLAQARSVDHGGVSDEGVSVITELESELRLRQSELDAALAVNQDLVLRLAEADSNKPSYAHAPETTVTELQSEVARLSKSEAHAAQLAARMQTLEERNVALATQLAGMSDYEYKHTRLSKVEAELAQHQATLERLQQRRASKRLSSRRSYTKNMRSRLHVPALDEELLNQYTEPEAAERGWESPTVDLHFDSDADTEPYLDDDSNPSGPPGSARTPVFEVPMPSADLVREHRELQKRCEQLENRLASMADYEYKHQLLREAGSIAVHKQQLDAAQCALAGMADYEYKTARLATLERQMVDMKEQCVAASADCEVKHRALLQTQEQLAVLHTQQQDASLALEQQAALHAAHSQIALLEGKLAEHEGKQALQAQQVQAAVPAVAPVRDSKVAFDTGLLATITSMADYEHKHAALLSTQQELAAARREIENLHSAQYALAATADYELKHRTLMDMQRRLSEVQQVADRVPLLERQLHAAHPADLATATGPPPVATETEATASLRSQLNDMQLQLSATADYEHKHRALLDAHAEIAQLRQTASRADAHHDQLMSMSDYEHKHQALLEAQQEISSLRSAVTRSAAHHDQLALTSDYEHKHLALVNAHEEIAQLKQAAGRADVHHDQLTLLADYEHKHRALLDAQDEIARLQKAAHHDHQSVDKQQALPDAHDQLARLKEAAARADSHHNQLVSMSDYEHKHQALLGAQAEIARLNQIALHADAHHDRLALASDYEHKHQALLDAQHELSVLRSTSHTSDLETVSALYDQALTLLARYADHEYKHARLLELEGMPTVATPHADEIAQLHEMVSTLIEAKQTLQEMLADSQAQLHESTQQRQEQMTHKAQLMADLETLQSLYSHTKMRNAELEDLVEDAREQAKALVSAPPPGMASSERSELESRIQALQNELDVVLEKNMTLVMQLSEFQ
ncbi:hypothetical protein RI367_000163 [Sorochytrium milnesiophthora]